MSCLLTRLSLSRGLEHVHTPPPPRIRELARSLSKAAHE